MPIQSKDLSEFPPGWQDELRRVSDAIFGTWQAEDNKRQLGVLERLRRIEVAGLFVGGLVVLKFSGVPTEKIYPIVMGLFGQHGGN